MFFKKKNDDFTRNVRVNNLPILILDETFNYTFKNNKTDRMIEIEEELRELLKEQGALNNEFSQLQKTKKIRLSKIIGLSGEVDKENSDVAVKKMGENQELVEHINGKLQAIEKKLDVIPDMIERKNYELFQEAVKVTYNDVSKTSAKIKKIEPEIEKLREKLKEKTDEMKILDDEFKEKSLFLRTFIGYEGIEILNSEYGGTIK